jgi:pimeloyl-ACP methyl ester carboxylesterase
MAARSTLYTVLLLATLGVATVAHGAGPAAPALRLSACQLENPLRLTVVAAECGVLNVPENPAAPHGRQIALHVARVSAVSRSKLPDPLFVLAGGPGQAAGAFYAATAPAFERIRRERDIVLVDQRGTGGSNRLDCPMNEEFVGETSEAEIVSTTRACLAALAPHADVAYYTTSLAVEDLERVRAALGYERINLYGSSYGTRVAQQYLRHYGKRVRSVILDGVVPVDAALGARAALDAESALAQVLARCANDPYCHAAFGDAGKDYRAVRAALANRAIYLTVPDPASGAPAPLSFGAPQLATVLRLGTYSAEYAALLPLLLHRAAAFIDYAPLAAQFLAIGHAYGESIAAGVHNSVVCAEDVPRYEAADLERTRRAAPYLGTTQIVGLQTLCRLWPRGPVDADLHSPLASDVPALLLAGGADPVTPPAGALRAAAAFRHARTVVLAGLGHGELLAPCMDRVMAQFVSRGAIEGLDVSCSENVRPLPFFTSLNGPPP